MTSYSSKVTAFYLCGSKSRPSTSR